MKYWLYTDEPPYEGFDEWGLCTVEDELGESEDGIDMITVIENLYVLIGWFEKGQSEEIFDDSVTDDPKRVIPFLFDQRF